MTDYGFSLRKLVVSNSHVHPAVIHFAPGLNVISGLSDTGKSYIFQCIDFMLGAQTPPKALTEGSSYNSVRLELETRKGDVHTLERSLLGGSFNLYNGSIENIGPHSSIQELAPKLSKSDKNISSFILSLCGITSAKVKSNKSNKLDNLSFRTVSQLFLVSETEIISEASPITTDQATDRTRSKSAFKFLLTGIDDSELVEIEDVEKRHTQEAAKREVYDQLIAELEQELRIIPPDQVPIAEWIKELEKTIEQSIEFLRTSSAEIIRYQEVREEAWEAKQEAESRLIVIDELLKRFGLLRQHYLSDLSRLEFIAEGDHYFDQLETINCPLCGLPLEQHTYRKMCVEKEGELIDIQKACLEEAKKIKSHLQDLESTIATLLLERQDVNVVSQEQARAVISAEHYIAEVLQPRELIERTQLEELEGAYRQLVGVQLNTRRLNDLKATRAMLGDDDKIAKVSRPAASPPINPTALHELCNRMQLILSSWKLETQIVEFNERQMDFIIDDKPRQSYGKGMRAIIRAAFSIAFMRYCNEKNLPHPGIVVLDSPLTTFKEKGATLNSGDDEVAGEVQIAFFEHLSATPANEQIIILENKEPPSEVKSRINFIKFVGKSGEGRRGFFPEQ